MPYNFRTRVGCSIARRMVEKTPSPKDEKARKAAIREIAEHVASKLRNTYQMAIKSYIDPKIWELWD